MADGDASSKVPPSQVDLGTEGVHDRILADQSAHTMPLIYLTADVPGTGGIIKVRPEDFIVEEIPAYQPCGEGEHIYLFVQKVGLSTGQLVEIIARHFGVRSLDIGFAGMKDKRAVTRQVLSVHVPGKRPEEFPTLLHEKVQVLWVDLHTNKLRRGHLAGNRFAIRIRECKLSAVLAAKRSFDILEKTGVPNRAGEQRFGMLGNNHLIGRDLLLGRWQQACDELLGPSAGREGPMRPDPEFQRVSRMLYAEGKFADALRRLSRDAETERPVMRALADGETPEVALRRMSHLQWNFFLTSLQSAVFNAVLDARLQSGTLGTLLEGDIAFKHDNGACFAVDAATAVSEETTTRAAAVGISPSGPMWGRGMLRASGATAEAESAALGRFGLCDEDFTRFAEREEALAYGREPLGGARRALRMPLTYPEVEAGSDEAGVFVRCSFELPPGGFATTVMQEVMKVAAPEAVLPLAGAEQAAQAQPVAGDERA